MYIGQETSVHAGDCLNWQTYLWCQPIAGPGEIGNLLFCLKENPETDTLNAGMTEESAEKSQ